MGMALHAACVVCRSRWKTAPRTRTRRFWFTRACWHRAARFIADSQANKRGSHSRVHAGPAAHADQHVVQRSQQCGQSLCVAPLPQPKHKAATLSSAKRALLRSSRELLVGCGASFCSADACVVCFCRLLLFLYTEHTDLDNNENVVDVLQLANMYGAERLLTLCELYVSKMVEAATAQDIRHQVCSACSWCVVLSARAVPGRG